MHKALHLKGDVVHMCREKKEEEDSLELNKASIHHYNVSKTYIKDAATRNKADENTNNLKIDRSKITIKQK